MIDLLFLTEDKCIAGEEKIGYEGDEKVSGGPSKRHEGSGEQQVGRDRFAVRTGCGERFNSFSIFRLNFIFYVAE